MENFICNKKRLFQILDPPSLKLETRSSRCETRSSKFSRIDNQVSRREWLSTYFWAVLYKRFERIALYSPYTYTWISHRLVICQLTVGKLINACCENVMTDEITTCFATNVKYAASSSLPCLLLINLTVSYKLPLLLPNEIWKKSPVPSSLRMLN